MTDWHKQKLAERDAHWAEVQSKIMYVSKAPQCWKDAQELVGKRERRMRDVAETNRRSRVNYKRSYDQTGEAKT